MSHQKTSASSAAQAISPPVPEPLQFYLPTDRPDVPHGTEVNSDDAWTEFQLLSTQTMRVVACDGDDSSATSDDSEFAPTSFLDPVDVELPSDAASQWHIDDVIALTQRVNRVYPKPDEWRQMYSLLVEKNQAGQNLPPPPPTEGAAWAATSTAVKKMCLLSHLEWADRYGELEGVAAFLNDLPEDRWLHVEK